MKKVFFFLLMVLNTGLLFAQSNPAPQTLPYTQDFSSFSGSTTVYPAGWQGWTIPGGISTTFITAAPSSDATLSGGTAATATNGVYDFNDKIGMLYSGTVSRAICLSINTTGLSAINISFDAMTIRNPYDGNSNTRINEMILQYRIGNTGAFTNISGTEYQNNTVTQTSGTAAQNLQSINITLPGAINNQPEVQLRWVYRDVTGAGGRPSMGVDNISVSGTPSVGIPVSLSASASNGSEANTTVITLTATASSAVTANETIDLAVSGIGISAGDYTLSNSQITIANGQTTGNVTFTIVDDNLREGLETAIVAINSVSAGLTIGSPSSVSIDINDNDDAIVLTTLNSPSALTTFDELDTTGISQTNISRGIYFFELGSSANTTYAANNGGSSTGNTYSYGLPASSDRALGSIASASLSPNYLGAKIDNNTGTIINAVEITYIGEQWRIGSALADSLKFELSTDASSLNTGTWFTYNSLNFNAPQNAGSGAALDGNDPANRILINDEITGFGNIANGASFWIRWVDVDVTGSDHGLAIDSLSIIPKFVACNEPNMDASNIQFSNPTGTSVTVSWTNGTGIGRILIGRQGSPVSDPPADGINYTANTTFGTVGTELGTGYVLYNGSGNTANITGLTPGVTYHFAVVEYNCNPADYRLANPATANYTTPTTPAIFTNVTTLNPFSTQVGVATLPDSIEVSGQFLTNDIVITAPAHFQVSLVNTSGFGSSLNLTPVSGTISPTWIYVRFNPSVSGLQSGNITHTSTGANSINVAVSGNATAAGTLPATYPLCSGSYVFNNWAATETAGTYPTNMIFHRFNSLDPTLASTDTANYTGAYNGTSGTRINGLGVDGISFVNTGTGGNLGAAVVGLNTLGRNNITIDFTAGTVVQSDGTGTPRIYNIRLQYRIGNGVWQDVPGPIEYSSAGQTNGHSQQFTGIALPSSCDNQSNVYVRWFYHFAGGSLGSRPRLRIDDISINSASLNPSSSDAIAVNASEAIIIPATTTGTINSVTDGIQAWEFTIRDGGTLGDADNLPTGISSITLSQGVQNTVSNYSTTIAAAALFDGSVKLQDGVITSNTISFSGLNEVVADDATKTYSIRLSLTNTGNIVDGSIIQFTLSELGLALGNSCNSSGLAAFQIQSDGTKNVISVTASQLVYDVVPANVNFNQNFTVTVSARDANNNIDTGVRTITLSRGTPGSGTLSSVTGLGPQNMLNGAYTWNDVQYNTIETFQLVATDNSSIPLVVTTLINCIDPCAAPSVPASALTFSNVTSNSMTLNWTNGTGSGRIVVARQSAAVANAPTNGTTYTANANYGTTGTELGSAYVVYNGSGNTFNLTGLTPNTSYFFAVYEYDCSPVLYNVVSPATGMRTTQNNVGIANINKSNIAFGLFPNPATGGDVYFTKTVSIEVYDALGKNIFTEKNVNKINVSGLNPGIYYLRTSEGEFSKMIIK
jgi:hypothetical protein